VSGLPDEVWDGNGGMLDAKKAPQRELLVSLHVKVDRLIADVHDHDNRLRAVEGVTARLIGAIMLAAGLIGVLGALVGAHYI
jgi:hypothetical protein